MSASLRADSFKALSGTVPSSVSTSRLIDHLDPSTPLTLSIVFSLQNRTVLDQNIAAMYSRDDPMYGARLTPVQFTARYAPSVAQYRAVEQFAVQHGLKVTGTSGNRLVLEVSGTASAVESAFQLNLNHYESLDGRQFYSPDRNPVIPESLSSFVAGIAGLDNASEISPSPLLRPDADIPHVNNGTGPMGGLAPNDIRTAYGMTGTNATGGGQTLAIFSLNQFNPTDIAAYEAEYNLTVPVTPVPVEGGTSDTTSALEVTTDIEMTMAMAPGISRILVYEGAPTQQGIIATYNQIAMDNLACAASTSYSQIESQTPTATLTAENNAFTEMAMQNQAMFAASGDRGPYNNGTYGSINLLDPSTQPYVVAVGGTSLTTKVTQTWLSETAWGSYTSPTNFNGGGGGISSIWSIPSWQVNATTANWDPEVSTTMRNVPDVSLDANPNDTGYSIYYNDAWTVIGGTSCAAPLWSGFDAIVNQLRVAGGESLLGFPDPAFYAIGDGPNKTLDFHDIADNSTNLYYHADYGYDLATGWGSMHGDHLLYDLTPVAVPAPTITPNGGNIVATDEVNITDFSPQATIYYTTDGSTPTRNSQILTSSLEFDSNTTLKAFAVQSGHPDSPVTNAIFTVQSPLVVTSTADTNTPGTLRYAMNYAMAYSGATITFDVSGTITLTSTLPPVTSNLTIQGIGAGQIAISGGLMFYIEPGVSLTLSGLQIRNGGGDFYFNNIQYDGGAIYDDGTLSIEDCLLTGNEAFAAGYSGGCIIISSTGSATIDNCTLSNNTTEEDTYGAPGNGGAIENNGTLIITNSTLNGNSAANATGGAIESTGTLVASNCTFVNNTSEYGGAIYSGSSLQNSIATITSCTITQNTAGYGGGIYNGGFVTLRDDILVADEQPEVHNYSSSDTSSASFCDITGGVGGATGIVDLGSNIDSNPSLNPLGYYGGLTQTMELASSSPLIGAGTSVDAPTTDQRGVTRPNAPSIGAYDVGPAITPTPIISPDGGSFTSAQSVTIESPYWAASISYTTDGSDPATSSTAQDYSGPFDISSTETVKAVAGASAVTTATFTIGPPAPTITPDGGSFASSQSVTLIDSQSGVSIYYTTDGTTPTISSTPYTAPFLVSNSETINAIAAANGYLSPVASATFTKTLTAAAVVGLAVPSDGDTRMLWNINGTADLWRLSPSGNFVSDVHNGPFNGWTPAALSANSTGGTTLLWTNDNGQQDVWQVGENGNYLSDLSYGPFDGWSVPAIGAGGSDGDTRLLWVDTDGTTDIWVTNSSGYVTDQVFGPFPGWTAIALGTATDSTSRLLWDNSSGAADIWTLTPNAVYASDVKYGPFTGWTASGVAVAPDGSARLTWTNISGEEDIWNLDTSGNFVSDAAFGPFPNYVLSLVASAPDDSMRLLWSRNDGLENLWGTDSAGGNSVLNSVDFGPF